MQLIVPVVTFIILGGLLKILNDTWDAGYWPLVILFPFALIGIAFVLSESHDKREFVSELRRIFGLRR